MACCFYLSLFNEYVAELLEAQTASKSRTLRVYYIHITQKQPNWFFFFFLSFSTLSLNLAVGLVVVTGVRLTALEMEKLCLGNDLSRGWGEHPLLTWCFPSNHLSLWFGADAILGCLLDILVSTAAGMALRSWACLFPPVTSTASCQRDHLLSLWPGSGGSRHPQSSQHSVNLQLCEGCWPWSP